MTSDVMNMCEDVSPVYILPGDPPDVKPDLTTLHTNDVSQRWLVSGLSAADGPLHLKAELTEIKVEYEQEDVLAYPSTITGDTEDLKSGLVKLEFDSEQQDPLVCSPTFSGYHDQSQRLSSLDDLSNGLSSQECTGEELRNAPMKLRDGLIDGKCESVSESPACLRPQTTHTATTQAHTNADKGVLSPDVCKEESSLRPRHGGCPTRTSEKVYECGDCDAVFAWAVGLTSHRRMHAREKRNKGSHDQSNRPCSLDDQSHGLSSQECTGEELRNAPMELRDGLVDGKVESVSEPADHSRPQTTHTATTQAHTNADKRVLSRDISEEASSRPIHGGRRMRTSYMSYMCDDCGAVFAWSASLESHRRIHGREMRYRKNFSGTIVAQNMLAPTYEKPYKCGYCDEKFARPAELGKHMHLGTFKCVDCGKLYARRCLLARHRLQARCVPALR